MALTNPNKLVNVNGLKYFEGKLGNKYQPKLTFASTATCESIINELT